MSEISYSAFQMDHSQTTFDRSLTHPDPLILQFVLTSSIFSACLQRWCPLQVHVSLGSKGWVPAWCYLWHQWCWYITSPDRWNQPQQIGWEVLVPPWSWADRLGGIRIPNASWDGKPTNKKTWPGCVSMSCVRFKLCLLKKMWGRCWYRCVFLDGVLVLEN